MAATENNLDEGLIRVPEGVEAGNGVAWRVGVLALALGALIGTPLVDAVWGGRDARMQGVGEPTMEQRWEKARFADGSMASLVEDELKDRSLVRRELSQRYTVLLYGLLDEAGGNQAITGKDRWLFIKSRARVPDQPTDQILRMWAARLAAIERTMRGLGMRVIFLPIPRRAAIMGEYLPDDVPRREDLDRGAAPALRALGLEAVDFFDAFMEHEGPAPFYRADAHWNEVGEKLAAEVTMRQAGLLAPEEGRRTRVVEAGLETQGADDPNQDLLRFIGIHRRGLAGYLQGPDLPRYRIEPIDGGQEIAWPEPPKVALTGTSFSHRRQFGALLEHYGQFAIDDRSQSAAGPIVPLLEVAKLPPRQRGEILLAEVPIYTSIAPGKFTSLFQNLLRKHPLPGNRLIGNVPLALLVDGQVAREFRLNKGPEVVLRTQNGALLSTWDHVVSVRVVGEVLEGVVELRAMTTGRPTKVIWKKGSHAVHLPLVSPNLGSRPVEIRALPVGGPARLRIKSAGFESALAFEETQRLDLIDQRSGDRRWEADYALPAGEPGDRERILVVAALPGKGQRAVPMEVVQLDERGAQRGVVKGRVIPGGWIIASLGPAGRGGAATVRISGPGQAPPGKLAPAIVPVTY